MARTGKLVAYPAEHRIIRTALTLSVAFAPIVKVGVACRERAGGATNQEATRTCHDVRQHVTCHLRRVAATQLIPRAIGQPVQISRCPRRNTRTRRTLGRAWGTSSSKAGQQRTTHDV